MRDFCENQIEINTDPFDSAEEALEALRSHESKLAGILERWRL